MIKEVNLEKLTPQQFKEVKKTLNLMTLLELSTYLDCSYRNLQKKKEATPSLCCPIKIGSRIYYNKSLVDKYISKYPFLQKHKKKIYGEKNKSNAIDCLENIINKIGEQIDK